MARWIGSVVGRVPGLEPERIEQLVRSTAEQLRQLGSDVPRLRAGIMLAATTGFSTQPRFGWS